MPITATIPAPTVKNPSVALPRQESPAEPETAVLHRHRGPVAPSRTERARQAKSSLRLVVERDLIQAIDRWLDGAAWEGRDWVFNGGSGLRVRLTDEGDALTQDGQRIVSRSPIRLCDLAAGTRTGVRLEARALAAVAVRGDAGSYDGKPRRVRDGVRLVWDGRQHVHGT